MEINLCLVCNDVSLSLFFQAFPVLLRLGDIKSKMHGVCCSLLFTLSVLPCIFLVCWAAEDVRGKKEGWVSEAVPQVGIKLLQRLESAVCFEGLLSGHKCAPDMVA